MNIIVAIITRENPLGLITLVNGLDGLASGNHHIRYSIRYDDDDAVSWNAIQALDEHLPDKVWGVEGPRPVTLGEAWNDALQGSYLEDWEIAVTLPNDVIPLCEKWDDVLTDAKILGQKKLYAISWRQTCDPTNPVFPTIRREWYEAMGNKLFPEWFPFWFSDTWIIEVHQLAFGTRLPICTNLTLGGKHDKTSGMRDLRFWFLFFAQTRSLRIEEAGRLAGALNRSPYDSSPAIAEMKQHDAWQLDRIPLYEKWFGANQGEPSVRYLIAKRKAEDWLKENCNGDG